ncbi:MAG: hypothetical protein KatS3mg062_1451 [Tepidiforma sp.]|nr:MAG: hypothetical protein KatS3mg062_1451 [Tepidiforma sp.]
MWPSQQTKTAYFYATEYCYPAQSQVCYRFWESVHVS